MAKRKGRLAPILENESNENEINKTEIKQENSIIDSEHITESASLDDYEKASINEVKDEFKDSDRTLMSEEIKTLREENETLKNKIILLENSIESNKTSNVSDSNDDERQLLKTKNESLENENDELILKNSDLEYEISRLNVQINTLLREIDKNKNTYTKEEYDKRFTVKKADYITGQNGYQFWA